jgi:Transposase DNA-binding/Transposase Tn5 dimerisation domain
VGLILPRSVDLADCPEIWATRIAAAADLPDKRLNTRLAAILKTLARKPKDPIPQAAGDVSRAKGMYRFFDNKRFGYQSLVGALAKVTAQSCIGLDRVYLAHDSSSLNYSSLHSTTGLGRLGSCDDASGLVLHSVLALNPEGSLRGLLSVDLWHRPLHQRTKEKRYERAFQDKESFKWVRGMCAARTAFDTIDHSTPVPRRIHLMDREGDIHEVFADILAHGEGGVLRCAQNRKIDGPIDRAHAAVAASPLRGTTTLLVHNKDRSTREATLQLRALPVLLTPSQRDYPGRQPLALNLIEAREIDPPPPGKERIRWLLWTTESISGLQDVLERLREYALRWRIEEYHLALKSGCNTESLLLETAERLCKAIVLYAAVAARIVTLRDLGKHTPDAPCTILLSEEESYVLSAHFASTKDNNTIPTIRQAMLWIGRLGGHLGRKSDGLPGIRTLWRGWRDLAIMVFAYRMNRRHQPFARHAKRS